MNEIELKSKNLETIVLKNRKNWKLGYAYIIPKDKDITRWRPIVSYWGFITDKIGHKMSRSLSVVINCIQNEWTHINLNHTTDFAKQMKSIDINMKLENFYVWISQFYLYVYQCSTWQVLFLYHEIF